MRGFSSIIHMIYKDYQKLNKFKIMNEAIENKRGHRIIQAFPIFIFFFFVLFYLKGNIDIYDKSTSGCTGLTCAFVGIVEILTVIGTILAYSLIYLISLIKYSPKFSVVSGISILLFLFGISNIAWIPSHAKRYEITSDSYKSELELYDKIPGSFSILKKSEILSALADHTKDSNYHYQALGSLSKAIELDHCNYKLYKAKSDILLKLAKQTEHCEFYKYSITTLETYLKEIKEDRFYLNKKIKVDKELNCLYYKWENCQKNYQMAINATVDKKTEPDLVIANNSLTLIRNY